MLPSEEELLAKARNLPSPPFAVEAYWKDFDVVLAALLRNKAEKPLERTIAVLRDEHQGPVRVAPLPQGLLADSAGKRIAEIFGVPFWFPSPNAPQFEPLPRFLQRERASPCEKCGLLVLHLWRDRYCYMCNYREMFKGRDKLPTREEILAKARELPSRPFVIEAAWDGDSYGWFVWLGAMIRDDEGRAIEHHIASLSAGGDYRVLVGQVPPWPEARLANEVGQEIAALYGVPFWFPSPNHPELDCPRYLERAGGWPCRGCGIPLLASRNGYCDDCDLTRKHSPDE